MTRTSFMNCHFAAIYILLSVTMFISACNSLDPTGFGKEIFEQCHKVYFPFTDAWVNTQPSLH